MFQPTLENIHASSVWNPANLYLRFPTEGNVWNHFGSRINAGKAKTVLGYKTKGFIPGKTWKFNPYDIRYVETVAHATQGTICRATWPDGVKYAILDWNGNLASWLVRNDNFGYAIPAQYVCPDSEIYMNLIKAAEKINTPEADYGVMLAELTETLGMLVNPLAGLRKFIRKVSRRAATYKETADVLAGMWLEIRYGVTPFLSDINTLISKVSEITRLKGQTYRVSTKSPVFSNKTQARIDWCAAGSTGLWIMGERRQEQVLDLYCHILYTPTIDFVIDPLGARNLPSLLWEKTSYSFVCDWFIDIGSWLRAIQVNPDILFYGNTNFVSYRDSIIYETQFACNQVGTTPLEGVYNDSCTHTSFSGYRHVNLPLPALPQVNVSLDKLKRQLDGISLIWQQIAKNIGRRVRD